MSAERIAIVGIGLCFPDASSPEELWENVLAGRRAFRTGASGPAAVLRDSELDPVEYEVSGRTNRSADLTHWLALNVASLALADARFPDGDGLPKPSTGVVIGDSLAGELARAAVVRARWPHVSGAVAGALAAKGWPDGEIGTFLRDLEARYLAPFPRAGDDLAGTIARGVAEYFELGGGAYAVDDACAASLLSVATAAKALIDGDIDVAVAGGVELPVDPSGADPGGDPAGEGAGLVVLMRERDALAQGRRVYATITGWSVVSDGMGKEDHAAGGWERALRRAYDRAGYGVETVSTFEGQPAELAELTAFRDTADVAVRPATLGSVTANLGHAGAAAGIAGLIKAVLSVYYQVIPPESAAEQAQPWPADEPVRAGISAGSHGGVYTHVTIEQAPGCQRRTGLGKRTTAQVGGRQDAELLLLDAADPAQLRHRLARLAALAPKLTAAELTDLAGTLAPRLGDGPLRAAAVARDPQDAGRRLDRLLDVVNSGQRSLFAPAEGVFLDNRTGPSARIAFLFPGNGCGQGRIGAIRRRFTVADGVFRALATPSSCQETAEAPQACIVAGSLAALRVLESVGVDADVAVGHSLGELTALSWAGAMGGAQLLRLATSRGEIMSRVGRGGGAMASLATGPGRARALIDGGGVVIAAYNGPRQTVISGVSDAVARVCARAEASGVPVTPLDVPYAFHSPLVRPAADVMAERLAELRFASLRKRVVSTVTGEPIDPGADLRALLRGQILHPVRFQQAAATAVADADLAIELGPGNTLTGLLDHIAPGTHALAVDTDDESLAGLLGALGAAHALGVPLDTVVLFAGRVVRPLVPELASAVSAIVPQAEPVTLLPVVPTADAGAVHGVDVDLSAFMTGREAA